MRAGGRAEPDDPGGRHQRPPEGFHWLKQASHQSSTDPGQKENDIAPHKKAEIEITLFMPEQRILQDLLRICPFISEDPISGAAEKSMSILIDLLVIVAFLVAGYLIYRRIRAPLAKFEAEVDAKAVQVRGELTPSGKSNTAQ